MKQRILAILLSLTMIFTLVPTAMAEGEEVSAGEGSETPEVEYVAQIGDAKYDTLAEAVEAVPMDNTETEIVLLKDYIGSGIKVVAGKNIVFNLNGKTYTVDKPTVGSSGTETNGFQLLKDSKVTFKNGTLDSATGADSLPNGGILIQNYCDLTLENVTLDTSANSNISYVISNNFGSLTAKGNTVIKAADGKVAFDLWYGMNSNGRYDDGVSVTFGTDFTGSVTGKIEYGAHSRVPSNSNWKDKARLTIANGNFGTTFVDSNNNDGVAPEDFNITIIGGTFSSDVSAYVPNDYIQNENGTVETLGETNAVAKVGDTYYKTLAEAVAAADNATVTLLKDVTANVTIPADKTITLDLNGMTLTNVDDHTILNNGNLTITGTGMVDNISHAKGALYNKGTVVINGGTFDRSQENGMNKGESGQNSWYTIKNVGTMTINDGATVQTAGNNAALGKFSSLVSNGYFNTNDYNTNKGLEQPILTIDGGTFRGGLNTIKNDDRARLTINGGTFSNYYQAVVQNHNIAEITGGTFTAASDANTETYGIYNCGCGADIDLGTLTVSGGTFTGATYAVAEVSSQNAIVNISGGQFAGTKAAIIKSSTSNATIAISGGSFSQSVERKYLDRSLNAELKRASGETPYSYYTSMNDALAAAKPGDTVTDLNATTESKVTLTLKYNDGATADTTYNVASGTTITLPTPAHRSGYTFNGWYDGSKFYAAGASYKVSATATLNASWSYISSGSSSYDPTYSVSTPSKTENGSVTVSPKSASKGDTVTITVKPNSGYVLETLTVTDKNGNELTLKDKGDGKYTFTMPAGKVEVKATFMEDNSMLNFFYDVPNGAYFYEAVKWAVKNGITTGVGNDLFAPEQPCTRAQIVTFLWRAAGSPEPKTMSSFTDVPASAYYAKAVAWAVENGITNGMTATMFAPDATCTRGQSVTFLHRALKGTASSSTNFTDVKSDAFYADAINWAVANNVTNGTSNTTFSPDADCTRAEIVTFLYRAYQGK